MKSVMKKRVINSKHDVWLFANLQSIWSFRLAYALYKRLPAPCYSTSELSHPENICRALGYSQDISEQAEQFAFIQSIRHLECKGAGSSALASYRVNVCYQEPEYILTDRYAQRLLDQVQRQVEELISLLSVNHGAILYFVQTNPWEVTEQNRKYQRLIQRLTAFCTENGIQLILIKALLPEGRRELPGEVCARVQAYADWVTARIPHFFENNTLHLLDKTFIVSSVNEHDLAEKMLHADSQAPIQVLESEGNGYTNIYELTEKVLTARGIAVEKVSDTDRPTCIDRMLEKILQFYYRDHAVSSPQQSQIAKPHVPAPICRTQRVWRESAAQTHFVKDSLGKTIEYQTIGHGDTILIVNAYGVDAQAWERLVQRLAQHYRVIYWKTRGLFDRDRQDARQPVYGIQSQIQDILTVANKENLSSFHLVSWCSGAKVSLLFQEKYPQKVKSLIFIAGEFAPFVGSRPFHSKFREDLQLIAALIEEDKKMLDFYMKIIHQGMFNRPVESWTDNCEVIFEIMPVEHRQVLLSPFETKETMVNFLKMCIDYYQYDVTEELRRVEIPTLFLAAEYDRVAPCMQSKWAHENVRGSTYICLPSATHLLILEQTEDVFKLLHQHIQLINT